MHSSGTGEIVIASVVLVWVVVRQVQPRPLIARTMFGVPVALAVLGLLALAHDVRTGHALTSADAAWIAADLALSAVTGAVRAPAVRIFERDGQLWRQGGPRTIALWLLSIGLRAGIGVLATRAGAGAGPGDTLLLSFGVSLAVQYLVLALRARRFRARARTGQAGHWPPTRSVHATATPRAPSVGAGRLARAGRWSARHPWWLIGAWLLVLVAATLGHKALGGTYSDDFTLPGSPAAQGAAVLKAHNPGSGGQDGQLVFTVSRGSLAKDKPVVEDVVAQVRKLPDVLSASDPLSPASTSKDGQTAYSTVHFSVDPASLGAGYLTEVNNATTPARSAGIAVSYGGQLGQADQPKASDLRSEAIGVVAAILVLLLGFGSVYAAGLPLVTAILGTIAGVGVLGMAASATTFASVSPTLGVMMGLGVGIDYALFLTTRHRQLVMDGTDPAEAAGAAIASSGRSVLIAAATVIIAVLGLYASGIAFIGKLGLAAAITVAVAALCAVTLVPALLGLAGRGIDRRRVRQPVAESAGGSDFWHRYARWISRHRWLALGGGVAVLLVLAAPVLSLQLGHIDAGASPDSYSSKQAYDAISSAFGPGANGPLTVVAQLDRAKTSTPAQLRTVESSLSTALAKVPDVASVSPIRASADGAVLSATVIPASRPQDAATRTLVDTLQDTALPAVLRPAGAQGYVTGSLAGQLDFLADVSQRLPLIIGVVIAAAFLLLLASFRSPVLALKAAILNFFSIGAAIGVIVAVFQWGWGSSLLGVSEKVPIESYVPMIMFAIVFGLSMDYEVFLLTRVREAWGRTHDNAVSVAEGLSATARVISCAALIITCVFLAFLLSGSVVVKMLALGLGVSIIVDATLIRLLVVPATMFLLGNANWWTPRWLTRLPNLLEPVTGAVQAESADGAPTAPGSDATIPGQPLPDARVPGTGGTTPVAQAESASANGPEPWESATPEATADTRRRPGR